MSMCQDLTLKDWRNIFQLRFNQVYSQLTTLLSSQCVTSAVRAILVIAQAGFIFFCDLSNLSFLFTLEPLLSSVAQNVQESGIKHGLGSDLLLFVRSATMPIDRYNCHENSRGELSLSPASLFICRGLSQCYLPGEFFEKTKFNFQLDICAI